MSTAAAEVAAAAEAKTAATALSQQPSNGQAAVVATSGAGVSLEIIVDSDEDIVINSPVESAPMATECVVAARTIRSKSRSRSNGRTLRFYTVLRRNKPCKKHRNRSARGVALH